MVSATARSVPCLRSTNGEITATRTPPTLLRGFRPGQPRGQPPPGARDGSLIRGQPGRTQLAERPLGPMPAVAEGGCRCYSVPTDAPPRLAGFVRGVDFAVVGGGGL